MSDLFADTVGWGHLVDPTQSYHELAASLYRNARQQGRKLVTTNYVITKLVALMNSPLHLPKARMIAFIEGLRTSPFVEIVHISATLDEAAWRLFKERQDKEWSLVDCSSFVVMQHCGIAEAFTTDHHFEQAGFVCLLK